ncbi:G1/S-specific cyclin-D1 [Chionoecetes opilio]|uniref:G1/S-specific cyclin-D1 n=1 Tax=Chionoecetes opilio TaxID=41210 RepID=A0A8J4XT81_CHIOP|nr:G1/S-specific cyclin-D1 [Chionoecetes opilio]
MSWELLLVSKLGWDLAPITAFDFVDHLLCRVPFIGCDPAIARKHATTFLALAVTEPEFVQVEPSALAVASIISAVRGLIPLSQSTAALSTFAVAVNLDPHALHTLVDQIDLVVEREAMLVPTTVSSQQTQQPLTPTNKQQSPEPMEFFDGNKTPTEVTDIHF